MNKASRDKLEAFDVAAKAWVWESFKGDRVGDAEEEYISAKAALIRRIEDLEKRKPERILLRKIERLESQLNLYCRKRRG
jgi:hypothetical protein